MKEYRVVITTEAGEQFPVRFEKEEPLSEAQHKAAGAYVLDAYKTGMVAVDGGVKLIPTAKIRSMDIVEYEYISTPNPAGKGSPTAFHYGRGGRR